MSILCHVWIQTVNLVSQSIVFNRISESAILEFINTLLKLNIGPEGHYIAATSKDMSVRRMQVNGFSL